ncbi:MAG: hypothetical protein IIC53_01215 [Proteobacteria bacterium]|nr:hypothetical protein [Pseudomonadota bacterium]
MPVPAEISKPAFRAIWQTAKKSAAEKAKRLKNESSYSVFSDQLKLSLGPELDKWPKLYPDFKKMQAQKVKIEGIIDKYDRFAKKANGVDKKVIKTIKEGLKELRETLDSREERAKELIDSDLDLGLKKSKGKQHMPIMVFQHPDISSMVMKEAPKAKDVITVNKLPMIILLDDDSILKKIGDSDDVDALLAQKVRDAAKFDKTIKEIGTMYGKLAEVVRKDPSKFKKAEDLFEKTVEKACQDAADRGSAELVRLTKVRTNYRNYKIKTTVNLTLAITGTVAGAVSLGLAPFTGGASMIVTAIGVAKGAAEIGIQLAKIVLSAEELADKLRSDIRKLLKRYQEVKSGTVGATEMAVTLLNAVSPLHFSTIKGCNGLCGEVGDRIDGLEVKAGDTSKKLTEVLDAQEKVTKGLRAWEREAKALLTPKEAKAIEKLFSKLDGSTKQVGDLIDKVIQLNQRVKRARADHRRLSADLKKLSGKEPTWAKVGEVLIDTSANVAFLVSANVSWPDAYQIAESTKAIVDVIGNVAGSLDGAKSLIEDAIDVIEESAKN